MAGRGGAGNEGTCLEWVLGGYGGEVAGTPGWHYTCTAHT